MQDPSSINMRSHRGSALKAAVLLLLLGLVSTFTQAKYGQYFSKSKPSNFASKILKITRDGSAHRRISRRTLPRPSTPFIRRFASVRPAPRQLEFLLPNLSACLSADQLRSPPV